MNLHASAALFTRAMASIRALFGSPKIADADADLRAELEAHLAMQIDDNLRRGMTPDEARRQALISAGGLTVAAESTRAQRGLPLLDALGTDVRYALRSLRNRPAFTVAVIATLALGIGANTAMFTIINAVVLRPLPYPQPDRILSISQSTEGKDRSVVDELTYGAWHDAARTVTTAAYSSGDATFLTPNGAQRLKGTAVRGGYFDVFGVRPMLGRLVSPEDTRPNAPRVAVLSETLWRDAFGADTSVIGRTITSDDQPVTVIGVIPASFDDRHSQYWSALRGTATPGVTFYYSVVARLRDGATIDAARAELTTIARRTASDRPAALRDFDIVVKTLHDRRFGDQRKPLLVLFGAVVVLLLIACANLANLNLARAQTRQREVAVRLALGAGRWRLVRGMLCESVLLSLAGAGLGIVFARSAVRYLVRLSPSSVANADGITINLPVLLFTLGAAVLTGVAFGLSPALTLARRDVNQLLGSGGSRTSSGPRADLVRRVLVVAQLATALLLLTGAGLIARTFWNVTSIDAGFRPADLFVATVQLPNRYDDARLGAFYSEMTARIRALRGIASVSLADVAPLGGARMSVSSVDSAGRQTPRIDVVAVAPGYFETMGTRLIRGREFTDADRVGGEPVAVINVSLAQHLFGESNPVGVFASIGGHRQRVIGVAQDVLQRELEATAAPVAYFPIAQEGLSRYEKFMVRASGSASTVQRAIADITHSVDPSLPPPTFKNTSDILAEAAAPRQFTFLLLGVFAAIAGSLAVVGLYGLLSNLVADRTREIGIRLALGADAGRVTRLVLAQGAMLAIVGVTIGLVVSTFAVRVVQSQLFGVSARDPWTFTASAVLLVIVSFLASWLPARRASRIDPILTLRAD